MRRADAVRDYLVSKGIASSRLTTRGYGETRPAASNATRAGRAMNRRVVLIEIRN
jgi:OOP family OmpA-OmpF porin